MLSQIKNTKNCFFYNGTEHKKNVNLIIQLFPSTLIWVFALTVLYLFSFKFMKTILKIHREKCGHRKSQLQLAFTVASRGLRGWS